MTGVSAVRFAGPFGYRSVFLSLGVGVVLSTIAALLAGSAKGPSAAVMTFALMTALCLLATLLGWVAMRIILRLRSEGRLSGVGGRLAISVAFLLLGPLLILWVVSGCVLWALWGDPFELARDPVLDGLRAA